MIIKNYIRNKIGNEILKAGIFIFVFIFAFSIFFVSSQNIFAEEQYPECGPLLQYSPELHRCVNPLECVPPLVPLPPSNICVELEILCEFEPESPLCTDFNPPNEENLGGESYLYVETLEADLVTESSARLNGRGSADSSLNPKLPTVGYFRYSSQSIPPIYCNDIYGIKMKSTDSYDLGTSGPLKIFSKYISGLKPDTTYYYCAIVSNRDAIAYGGDRVVKSFTTRPLRTRVTTLPASQVTKNTAFVKGSYNTVKEIKKTYFAYKKLQSEEWTTVGMKQYPPENDPTYKSKSYSNFDFLIENLEPSTNYEFKAVVEDKRGDEEEIISGEILSFKTKEELSPSCEELGTCTLDEDYYCIAHPEDPLCLPNLTITSGSISFSNARAGTPVSISADIKNTGGVDVNATVDHLLQFSRDPYTETIDKTTTKTIGTIKANGARKATGNITFNEVGLYLVRMCADNNLNGPADDGTSGVIKESNETDNCGGGTINPGGWTVVNVDTPICPAPKFYDSESKSCVDPVPCDEETEVYDYRTNSCVEKAICDEETEIYNFWNNTCISNPLSYCLNNYDDPLCQPAPGYYPDTEQTSDDDENNDSDNVNWPSGGWTGGGWTGGGWVNGYWVGGTWTPNSYSGNVYEGMSWTGGVWKDGVWSGGGWNNVPVTSVGQIATPPWDAIVRYHEGVEHVFVRQIMKNTAIQSLYGYTEDMNLNTFAWDIADLFARILGYIGSDGKEIRVSYPDIAAYELRLVDGRLMVYEYYDYKIISVQNISTAIKTKADYEYYYNK
ncbi:MAG: hypothetical protein WC898_03300 [Candidatus Paceibacterota bacterium]|jgi:hypothetical protein